MRFYDALQLDPSVLKNKIKAADTPEERRRMQGAMVLRSFLIVAFAIVLIAPVGKIFGAENSPAAVAMFCILLSVRFVDFGYCIKDSMINFAVIFALLLTAPVVASLVHPAAAILVHFVALFLILVMGCKAPEMGNGGLFGFAYIYLTGNPVTGQLFWRRALLMLLGYLLCGSILYFKHRSKHQTVRFWETVSGYSLKNQNHRWQLRMAIGVSLALGLGYWFQVERFMWAGFAAGTMLSSYSDVDDAKVRLAQRIGGVIVGSLMFFGVYKLMPPALHSLLGPLGGICLGFCADYRFKTAINCFGALMLATGVYGPETAVMLRIVDNIVGVVFGFAVVYLYDILVDRRFATAEEAA